MVKTHGDDPLGADARAVPDGNAERTDSLRAPASETPAPDKPPRPRLRKRRRRRRRPVYAAAQPKPDQTPAAKSDSAGEQEPVEDRLPGQPESQPARNFYGALDLGTNNCRLLVAVPRERGFRVVDAFSRIVRLGEGIGRSRRLSDAAMGRSVEALKVCAGKLAHRRVERVRLIATEACRAAENGDHFVERVERETGLRLDIVSQETEARLAVAGCASLVDPRASGVILFDIGGGSSELVWIDLTKPAAGRRMSERIGGWMSLPLGVVNLSEHHGGHHVSPTQFEAMVAEVAGYLHRFPQVEAVDRAVSGGAVHMLGTSGTVTTLAGFHLGLERYDRRRVDGTWLTGKRVAELVAEFAAMDYAARVASPCIGRERADLVLAGCAILEAFRRRWPVERLRVADRGLREGLLVEMMTEDGAWRPRPKARPPGSNHG